MKIKIPALAVLAVVLFAAPLFPVTRITNYSSVLTVNALAVSGNTIWAGTSGGLYRYDCASGTGSLYSDPAYFPDLNISTLCLDSTGTLWIGTKQGYLYRRFSDGRQDAPINAYYAVGWPIQCIASIGRYLVIGSTKGCGLFDKIQLKAVKNAPSFGPRLLTPEVNAILIRNDSLILGCSRGLAKLPIGGSRLDNANFYDPSIWTLDSSWSFPVKSFVVRDTGYTPLSSYGALFNGKVISSTPDGTTAKAQGQLFADTVLQMAFPSMVNAIVADTLGGRHRCVMGTLFNDFYFWSGGSDTQHVAIDGPTFTYASGIYADREGAVWVLPQPTRAFSSNPWWEGISVFRNNRWQVYSPVKYPAMGTFGIGGAFTTAQEDPAGNMWFGTPAGAIKKWERATDTWAQYCVGAREGGPFVRSNGSCIWAECDGIAMDSLGYQWFGSWENASGPLLCYDWRYEPDPSASTPQAAHYRYFFPGSNKIDYTCLTVDAANNIIACNGDAGIPLQVFSYTGNPFVNDLELKASFPSSGTIYSVAATRDTLSYCCGVSGMYTYDPDSGSLKKGLWVRGWSEDARGVVTYGLKQVDSAAPGGSVKLQDDNTLWIGTAANGLVRYDLSAARQVDFSLGSLKTTIDKTQGLLSNTITQISIDRKNGNVWAATDQGVSCCHLDFSTVAANNQSSRVFPNPFSKGRHSKITFADLPPSSKVRIYTVSGSLVAVLSPEALDQSSAGCACVWNPPAGIVPGIYVYAVQSPKKNSRGTIIVAP